MAHQQGQALPIELQHILAECLKYQDRTWLLWDVEWAIRDNCPGVEESFFRSECLQALQGAPNNQVRMNWSDLQRCVQCVLQTEGGFFIALRPERLGHVDRLRGLPEINPASSPDSSSDSRQYNAMLWLQMQTQLAEISDPIIHAFDFTFWEVTTKDKELLQRLCTRFEHAELHSTMME
jgi:hypothetical protein